jgi:hypothetical protein
MGSVIINVAVSGGADLLADFDPRNALRLKYVIVREPGACALCVENEDPALAGSVHINCRCRVEVELVNA